MLDATSNRLAWLRLARCPTIGPVAFRKLLQKYGTAEKALLALPDLVKSKNIPIPTLATVEKEWEETKKLGGKLLWRCDDNYPRLLAAIDDAPPILAVLGHDQLLHRDSFAIVGARAASLSGEKLARRFAEVMAQKDFVLVSGMAKGIDAEVHWASIKTGTVAVLAGGVDYIYPRENTELYGQLKSSGCIVSESPLGAAPLAKNFPKRNRIISGLSLGLLVIEAALRSGTLITARYALDQGRELFAVPGSPLDQRMRGCNQLIKNGAHITETPDDILPLLETSSLRLKGAGEKDSFSFDQHDEAETNSNFLDSDIARAKRLLRKTLTTAPTSLDDMLAAWGDDDLPRGLIYQALLEMELAGEVEHIQGNNYALNISMDQDGKIKNLF
ncbi:MAG: DNA-processing protein DprA [Alphaproteobacteria bacterium]|nr:DNA-processing protein DprA [Alphaproteobacteria bacterium]